MLTLSHVNYAVTLTTETGYALQLSSAPSNVLRLAIIDAIRGEPGAPGAAGPAGPVGPAGMTYSRRYDQAGNYQYVGAAPTGSAETDPVWTVRRLTYTNGIYSLTETSANNVTWAGRASHAYS